MKKFILGYTLLLFAGQAVAQINAGPDYTICSPNCTTLTSVPTPVNGTNIYTVSSIPYGPPTAYNIGTPITWASNGDDVVAGPFNIGFTFCFFGQSYTQFYVGSNGWVSFSAAQPTTFTSATIPSTAGGVPKNCIMGPWQDWYPGAGGTVRYTVQGTAPFRRLVVSWDNVAMFSCTTTYGTFQIVCYETTNIVENHLQSKPNCAQWAGGTAVQGVHNAAGTMAYVVPGRNSTQWTATNEAWRYTPNGAAAYTVSWWNGPTQIATGTTVNVCPSTTTTYTAQILYTCNNVTLTDQAIVNVTVPAFANAGPDVTICQGNNTQLNASGGTSYTWSPATGLSCTNCPNPVASPVTTTTYVVTATSGQCSSQDNVVVTVTPLTTANAGPDDTICFAGSAQLNASGGTQYSWSPATGLSNSTIANPVASPASTTTYTVTVTNAGGCTGTDMVTITVPPQMTLATAGFAATCNGTCDGQTVVIPGGGIQPYAYLWSPGGQTTASVMNQCAGTYNIQVTDAIGCTATATVSVTEPPALVLSATSINANCNQPDGSATVTANGGTPPYSIQWPTGGTANTEINLPPGLYCVTVTDANNCFDTICVTVGNTPGVTASIASSSNVTCFSACNGSATVTEAGGTAPYSYAWAPSGGNAQTASGLCAGTYTVTVTDANNCSDTAIVTITEPTQVVMMPPESETICIGQTLVMDEAGVGGTPGYTYTWSPAGPSVSPVVTTVYSVYATDANGCISTAVSATITVNNPLNATALGTATVCPGEPANISATATGGDGVYTFTWLPVNIQGAAITVTPAVTTTYSVIVSDGCTTPDDTATVTITVAQPPAVTFTSDVISGCEPLCVSFTNTTPGIMSSYWQFTNGDTSTSLNPNICFNLAAIYDVTLSVVDMNGCTSSTTVPGYITVFPKPVAEFTFGPQPTTVMNPTISFTDNSTGTISAWQWSFGDVSSSSSILQDPEFTYPDSGLYEVILTVTTTNGCTDDVTHYVEIRGDFAFYIPAAFTPNGDELNDTFGPKGIGIDVNNYEFLVFDRWGNMLFNTKDLQKGWDGRVNGGDIVQQDVYVWKIVLKDKYDITHQYIGHVTIVR
jgi:large repetitive protein